MWKVHLENLISFGQLGFRMYVMREDRDGSFDVMQPSPILKRHDSSTYLGHDEAYLDDGASPVPNVRGLLQAMSDAAWEIGIRPKQIEDHFSELKATKYHLEDMRTMALK